jgi:thioredoxin 1
MINDKENEYEKDEKTLFMEGNDMAVITITKENFEAEVLKSAQPVLLDFWAAWCGPCRMLSPIVDEVAEERTDVKVGKVNVDEQPDLAAEFGVMSIPTLLLFENGKLVRQAVGARPKSGVLELLG